MTAASHQASRQAIHEPETFGEALADKIADSLGTWRAILIQAAITTCWFIANTVAFIHHWDAYPFVFLNLGYSIEAGFSTFIILLSQKRSAQRDHRRDEIEAQEVAQLVTINRQQLVILFALLIWPLALLAAVLLGRRLWPLRLPRP